MLKDHFLEEDYDDVMEEVNRIISINEKALKVTVCGQWELKNTILEQLNNAFENLRMLNQKKINQQRAPAINEDIRRHMF
ncbi:hypothetical protein [Oceanobacillus neutriphilus]|uniref:Uncharacterized protein n=1 Tax=Oceanobacillus neutriphilus TaxID=531815 RepID=A0ABQ2NR43_9BACI|nr:hypothetical protein [Oceanobacillus neutriphilus]GGP07911.1 hypothetical protein GCM10011346_06050 [Oceanobacillus neutriphilus]